VLHVTLDGVKVSDEGGGKSARMILEAALCRSLAFQVPAWLMVAALWHSRPGRKHIAVEKIERVRFRRDAPNVENHESKLFVFFTIMVVLNPLMNTTIPCGVAFTRVLCRRPHSLQDKVIAPDQLQFLNPLFVLLLIASV